MTKWLNTIPTSYQFIVDIQAETYPKFFCLFLNREQEINGNKKTGPYLVIITKREVTRQQPVIGNATFSLLVWS